jgi:hypothetical protein
MTGPRVNDSADDLLARVYRSTPQQAREFGRELTPDTRVQLALFCYNKAHLREHCVELASECLPDDLRKRCGEQIADSIQNQIRQRAAERATYGRRHVTLARPERHAAKLMFDIELEEHELS